ncbi:hypothetical protein HC138_10755, partial [Corynebacterium coyleae]|nr:hypothetical protein [Corynebacterium coyleae]
ADNLEIGDFSAMAGAIIDNKPEAPAKVDEKVEAPAADKADDKAEAPAQVEAEAEAEAPAKANDKANDKAEEKVQDQAEAEQEAPAKVDIAKKQADNNNKPAEADVNIAAIIAPIVALLAIVGIGIGFANMML